MEKRQELSHREIAKYKARLEEKYAELARSLLHRENIIIHRRPDAVDEAILLSDGEIVARALDANWTLLRELFAAMRRIRGEEYGVCAGCGEPIGQKRLDELPWTPLCIRCEQQRGNRQSGGENFQHQLDRAFSGA